jgi:hypothetical protein
MEITEAEEDMSDVGEVGCVKEQYLNLFALVKAIK